MRCLDRSLAAIGLLAVLAAVTLPATAQEPAPQAMTTNEMQARLLEPRWLPWLGCWELVADAVDYRAVESTGRRIVCVAPRLDGLGVNLTTQVDSRVIANNTVIADGTERALPEEDCSGRQSASWSADGRRLHSSVSASCGNDSQRSVTGVSMLLEGGRWLEIQSVSLDNGEHRELVVRHYDRLDDEQTTELGYPTLDPALAARAASARAGAAAPLDVDDVIEANAIFPAEVVEAAIVESGSVFTLDTNALIRLADAGIEDRVIDLMVAVSFPEQFVVDSGPSYGGGGGGAVYVGYYGYPMSCWGRYYSPFYGPYGPSCSSWWDWPYFGYYPYPPYYGGGGGGYYRPSVPPSGSLYGGKVIKGRGYSTPRAPVPLDSPSRSFSISERSSTGSGGFGYTVRRAVSRDGLGSGSLGGRRSTGGVSRTGGFSKPSSSGGGSSTGSVSSPVRTGSSSGGTAKPRGGGGGGGSRGGGGSGSGH